LAQTAFGYAEGERRLRHDLGFEVEEKLTLRHLAAHVTTERYQALMESDTAALLQQGGRRRCPLAAGPLGPVSSAG
jgi:hypothetical protein